MSAPWLLARPPFLPFLDRRMAHPPGLSPLDPANWLWPGADRAAQLAYRDRLFAERREAVLALLPEGEAAAAELLERLLAHLRGLPDYAVGAAAVTRPDGVAVALDDAPLTVAGRLAAEDWCLLARAPDGRHRLIGAALCFPSRWTLAEKIGRPLDAIHAPVPDYDDRMAARVERVFAALHPDRPVYRVNWLVHGTAELHLVAGAEEKTLAAAPPKALYLRTEHQTLRRLPRTGAVVFGIRTTVAPLDSLTAEEAAGLRCVFGALEPLTIAYRAGSDLHRRALDRLAEIAGQG